MIKYLYCAACMSLLLITSCSDKDDAQFPEKIYEGNLVFLTQEEVDLFGENNYTEVNGSITIGSGYRTEISITNVDKLLSLREANSLNIGHQFNLTNLAGLANLEKVEFLGIQFNNKLKTLNGLEKLRRVEGNQDGGVLIYSNENLESIKGLQNLEYIEGGLQMMSNGKIASLEGLERLKTVKGNLIISNIQGGMESISGVVEIDGTLNISFCPSITNLDMFESTNSLGGFTATLNESLSDFCGIQPAIKNSQVGFYPYDVAQNLFNPTFDEMISGTCSL